MAWHVSDLASTLAVEDLPQVLDLGSTT